MKTGNLLCRGLRETKENGMIKILGNRNKGEVLWLHTESENDRMGMAVTMTAGMTNVLTGCGAEREGQAVETSQVEDTSQGDEDTPAWKKYAGEPVTLDWYVNYSWFAIPWGENAVSQKITEETGVNINFITPIGNETEKLNALIASDSLPDLITLGYWEPQVNQMIEENMVYALNELADDYDAYSGRSQMQMW